MTMLLLFLVLLSGQDQGSQGDAPIRLKAGSLGIPARNGGKVVELLNSAPYVTLPKDPVPVGPTAREWYVDVKNLGPNDVTIQGGTGFSVRLHPKDVVRVRAVGHTFLATRP